jgi:hypothetical protein
MNRKRVWAVRALLCVGILAVVAAVRHFGIGRWWNKVSATDVRSSILSRLNSRSEYRQFTADLRRRAVTSLAIEFWFPIQRLRADRTVSEDEEDDSDLSDDELRRMLGRITYARGTIADGRYHVTIVVRREYRLMPFRQSIKLADCIGEASVTILSGQVRACSIALRDLKRMSDLNERFVGILAVLRDPVLPPQYRGATLQLLDGRACDFRTAQHIERLYSAASQWPNIITERLVHVGFIASLQDPAIYYRSDHFALASSDLLGTPKAFIWSERLSRICVLATMKNAFDEVIDSDQAILALEQVDRAGVTSREVRRVAAVDFNADLINGLLTGRISNPLLGYVVVAVLVIVCAIVVRYVLSLFVQLKILFTNASPNVTVVSGSNSDGSADTSQDGADTE